MPSFLPPLCVLRTRRSVKDVSGHGVKDVMGLNSTFAKGGNRERLKVEDFDLVLGNSKGGAPGPFEFMNHNTYTLSSRLPAETTIARVADLFAKEGVQYKTEGLSVFSISTPVALLSFDRTLYKQQKLGGSESIHFYQWDRRTMPVRQERCYHNCRSSEQV
jgi:hypothetical protein